MKKADSESCLTGLMDFVSHFGVPQFLSSDCGVQFLSNLWKKLESTLGIKLTRGPLYRPQAQGMVERAHRTFKDSVKAQILDFATKNQKLWPQLLPWALLSMRASFREDIQASPSMLAHGFQPALPGSLVTSHTPSTSIQDLLDSVKKKTNRKAVQTKLNVPNQQVKEPPPDATHAYTRQHDQTGLDPPYKGPFKIKERLSRSTVRLIVGHYASGEERTEDRHWSDLKAVKLGPDVIEESRPKLGRPSKKTSNPEISNIDFSHTPPPKMTSNVIETSAEPTPTTGPPPYRGFLQRGVWTATSDELASINASINTRGVS